MEAVLGSVVEYFYQRKTGRDPGCKYIAISVEKGYFVTMLHVGPETPNRK
jgi:hypothetical protein